MRRGGERGLTAKTMGFAVAFSQFLPPRIPGGTLMEPSRETMRAETTSLLVLDPVTRDFQRIEKGPRMQLIPNGRPTLHSSKPEDGRVNGQKKG